MTNSVFSSVCATVKYTMAMVGYGEMNETIVLELIYTYNVTEYTKGNGFVEVGEAIFFSFYTKS